MTVVLAIVFGLILMALIISLMRPRKVRSSFTPTIDTGRANGPRCPLCRSELAKDERIKTKLIEISGGKHAQGRILEKFAEIRGCPHCWPSNDAVKRVCPSCQTTLGKEDVVVGRYFVREGRKDHLRILGCPACRKNPSIFGG